MGGADILPALVQNHGHHSGKGRYHLALLAIDLRLGALPVGQLNRHPQSSRLSGQLLNGSFLFVQLVGNLSGYRRLTGGGAFVIEVFARGGPS